ncbi:hypothetical protein FGG08_004723 [Glutinoglossum americanum]|uniref:Uncharacterized protein n=1 Tax=Glutinoglossum americanum TaxID=1670608 RepID=A0A9P8HZY6_9PEZI|nr:hypothetical protein FGG08_004723 [Glutinoglossum americanum]
MAALTEHSVSSDEKVLLSDATTRCPEGSLHLRGGGVWLAGASSSPDDEPWVLVIDNDEHCCIGRGVRKFASSSEEGWLDPVVSRRLNVTKGARPKDIEDLLRVCFAEEIGYKVAQRCKLRLLDGDIGAQWHSFQLFEFF